MVTLVENGNPKAVVVVALDLDSMDQSVEDGTSQHKGPQIHIGNTSGCLRLQKGQNRWADLPVNGYCFSTVLDAGSPHLMITAKTSIGLSHGIYDLLTNELGVIWGMADPIFEEVPQRRTVEIPEINRITLISAFAGASQCPRHGWWSPALTDFARSLLAYARLAAETIFLFHRCRLPRLESSPDELETNPGRTGTDPDPDQ